MNRHHESMAWAIAVTIVFTTFILSVAAYEMQDARLKAQAVPQIVVESESP